MNDFDITALYTLAEDESGLPVYHVEPDALYPAMVARIREVLTGGVLPEELIDHDAPIEVDPRTAARRHVANARRVPGEAWDDALVPYEEIAEGTSEDGIARRENRAAALECARLWFTRALKTAFPPAPGRRIKIYIARDERYRL